MNFNDYQREARKTAIYPDTAKIIYPALGLANEAGEVLGKIKKTIRDGNGEYTWQRRQAIADEAGDVLWYLSALADDLGVTLEEIAAANLEKLADRANRGVIGGSGDKR